MKLKSLPVVLLTFLALCGAPRAQAEPINNMSSVDLVSHAWQAFNGNDLKKAITYSDECISRFGKTAQKMQGQLAGYPAGTNQEIHAYYALNDVATAVYIKAESLRKLDRADEAAAAYQTIIEQYSFGQCWDPRGWFWKPAVVSREKMQMIRKGKFFDFGDYSSQTLMVLAWKALDEADLEGVLAFTDKCIELYADEAARMQGQLKDFPAGSNEQVHAYYALNDVATAYFIQGEAYFKSDQMKKARKAYQTALEKYPFAQCWDPRGWFWQVAAGAKEKIDMIDSGIFMDFWDYSSKDLVGKAWMSIRARDWPRALGYAEKCIQLYDGQARKAQQGLHDFPTGTDEEIHRYWALNDVATAYYIKGIAYRRQRDFTRAEEQFRILHQDYYYGQCWDPRGWWWKPSLKAEEQFEFFKKYGKSIK